jgi:predicted permease
MLVSLLTAVRGLAQRRRAEREMDEELRFHVEMEIESNIARGLSPAEARRVALRDFGGVVQTKEAIRDVRALPVESMAQDARHALRVLAARPGFAMAVVGMLALAVGITTAMFTVVDALILRPVPFKDPDQLASVYMGNERGGTTTVAPAVLHAWRNSPAFAGAESASPDVALVDAGGSVVTRGVARVTPGIFDLLGNVTPVRGRLFDINDARASSGDRVLISEDLWRSLYRADAGIIGRQVVTDGEPATVVGVLPADFRFPSWDTVIWRPIDFDALPAGRANERARAYVRFAVDIPEADALRMATDVARAADATTAKLVPRVQPLAGLVVDAYYARAVPLLAGGVILVFLVLCANVCSLLLARLTARRREFSMRAALGASRGRLMRQALVESGVVGALGIVVGVGIAWVLVSLARAFLPEAFLLRTLNPLNIDLRALAITSVAGIVGNLAAGLLPAWMATRVGAGESLRVVDRGVTESRGQRAITRGLLVTEIALACTLLVGATLLVRSFANLARADRGLNTDGVITAWLSLPPTAFPDLAARESLARLIEDQIRELPAVRQVAWSFGQPPRGGAISFGDWAPDAPGSPVVNLIVEHYNVGPEFFALYDIPIIRGRTFEPQDTSQAVVVGERLARAFWPDLDPLGRTFRRDGQQFHVVGVAREIHHPSLNARMDLPEFYQPFAGFGSAGAPSVMMSARCGDPCPDPAVVRQRLTTAHPAIRVHEVRSLDTVYFEQLARPRAAAALGFAFAAIATLAAAGGLWSVLSYAVGRRRREFGIRTALGASPVQIRQTVLREGLLVALLGLAIGVTAAAALGNALASLQYGVTVADPVSWAIVLGLLIGTVAAASWRPAREAMRLDPLVSLRED